MDSEAERLVGTTVRFSTSEYPFDSIILAIVNAHLESRHRAPTALDRIHEVVSPSEVGSLYSALYDGLKSEPFASLYACYIERVIASMFASPIRYQRVPGIRVHLPDTHTVQYHTDEWYGHGATVVNFWLPLTRSFDTNALWVATLESSAREVQRLEAERATMEEINERLATIAAPVALEFGEAYVFCARVVHGTERNVTGKTRVSLDFRTILEGEDCGAKPLEDYYVRGGENPLPARGRKTGPQPKFAIAYLFPKHGFTRFVPTQNQRVVVSEFARTHGLTLVAEETEITTMPHHPTLLTLARGSGTYLFDSILAYSVLCLPNDEAARKRIYATAREHSTQIFFANENLSFPHSHAEHEIDRHRERVQG